MKRNLLGKGFAFPVGVDLRGNIAFSGYEKSVEESILLILGTTPGERIMRPDFGCAINEIIFYPNSPRTISQAVQYVEQALIRWEPRIILKKVSGELAADTAACVHISIEYEIRSVNTFFNMVYPFYLEKGEIDSKEQLR